MFLRRSQGTLAACYGVLEYWSTGLLSCGPCETLIEHSKFLPYCRGAVVAGGCRNVVPGAASSPKRPFAAGYHYGVRSALPCQQVGTPYLTDSYSILSPPPTHPSIHPSTRLPLQPVWSTYMAEVIRYPTGLLGLSLEEKGNGLGFGRNYHRTCPLTRAKLTKTTTTSNPLAPPPS